MTVLRCVPACVCVCARVCVFQKECRGGWVAKCACVCVVVVVGGIITLPSLLVFWKEQHFSVVRLGTKESRLGKTSVVLITPPFHSKELLVCDVMARKRRLYTNYSFTSRHVRIVTIFCVSNNRYNCRWWGCSTVGHRSRRRLDFGFYFFIF